MVTETQISIPPPKKPPTKVGVCEPEPKEKQPPKKNR